MCSAFTPDCEYDNSTIILIRDVCCPNTNFAAQKDFNLSAETIINVRNARLCARCAIFFLMIRQNLFFSCRLVKGFTFSKRVQNHFKMLLEMSIVVASIVPTERNVNRLGVT